MKKTYTFLLTFISITCIGLIFFFSSLFFKEYAKEETKYYYQFKNIYSEVKSDIDKVIEGSVLSNNPNVSFSKIDTLFISSFYRNNISYSYSWGLISHNSKTFIYISDSTYIKNIIKSKYKYPNSFKINNSVYKDSIYKYSLVMYFPDESKYILSNISNFLFVSISLLILFIAFILSIYFFLRQKKISEQKNDYINHMTHEVKTPVATTLLAIEALNDKAYPCNEEMRATYLNIILKEILRLQELVLQILNRARKENIDNTVQKELLHIHPIIEEAVESMSLRAKEKGGIIQLSLEAENAEIYGSPVHITNIIMNLMENAIKYTPQNPCIQITTLNTQKGIEIRIQDNGIGVAPQDQKKIFKKYYRASNHPNKESFGVGLNYVQHIVQLHKGKIRVESELGKGSTFIIYLKNI